MLFVPQVCWKAAAVAAVAAVLLLSERTSRVSPVIFDIDVDADHIQNFDDFCDGPQIIEIDDIQMICEER